MATKAAYLSEIKELVSKYGIDEVARKMGITTRAIGYWTAETDPKVPTKKTQDKIHELFVNCFDGTTPAAPLEAQQGDRLTEAILSITRSNEGLVRANTVIAEANLKLAEKVSASESEEIPLAIEARFSDLLELIAQLGIPTRWKNEKEAALELGRLWHGKKRDVSKVGIRDGSGR